MRKKLLATVLLLSIHAPAIASTNVDYLSLETFANGILCESESRCEDTQIKASDSNHEAPFYVEGILLPTNALRDEEQQKNMIAASLYIKKDGTVATIPTPEEISLSSVKSSQEASERNKVLPVQLFPAAEIVTTVNQIVISVK